MRANFLALAMLLAPLLATPACTKATVIGTECKADADCNVKGQICAPGLNAGPSICTHTCTGQSGAMGCPVGFDCFPSDPQKGSTCNKSLYDFDPLTGKPLLFGKDCALDASVCGGAGITNAAASCRKIEDPTSNPPGPVTIDPNAYCTGACTTDAECPLDFVCDTDYDMVKKCLRRTLCTPCTVDANCPSDFAVCVPTRDGKSRYCTKACTGPGDCGGVQNTALECAQTTSAAGTALAACLHRYGSCLGEGNICDPCFKKADCAKSNSTCVTNVGTGERFCTKSCSSDASCKPAGSVASACDNTDIATSANPNGMSNGICNGDTTHQNPGLFSCWNPL